jgi:hypothetical protein
MIWTSNEPEEKMSQLQRYFEKRGPNALKTVSFSARVIVVDGIIFQE